MKSVSKIALFATMALAFAACESANNYSKQLESEQKKIDAWFSRNGYSVLTECPQDSAFVIGQWYRLESDGIYFCLDSLGIDSIRIKDGNELAVRYIESSLEAGALPIEYWTVLDSQSPVYITKGSSINNCTGWDDAFELMRFSESEAQVIVPSKLGFDVATSNVTPYYYKLKIRKVPK